ncbi:MAG: PD-(D/E)XK nuclease family protein [Acidimicrobiia bacterium]
MIEFPTVAPGDDLVVSATTYVTYRTCPEQAMGRLRGSYPADTRQSFRGGLAHRVFARHLTSGPIDAEEFEQVCREEIGQGLNASVARLSLRPSELRGLVEEARELYARFTRFPTEGFRSAEVALEAEPAPGLVLRGKVDAVFEESGERRLVDWKTGSLRSARHQLIFYSLLWALERDELPVRVEAISVATGERVEDTPDRADLEACAEMVADLATRARAAFARDVLLARVAGPWCRYCAVLEDCSEGLSAAPRTR